MNADNKLLCNCQCEGSCRLHGTATEQREMVARRNSGETPSKIARHFHLSRSAVYEVLAHAARLGV